ncbi:MAG: PQQ-dependent sugar dehydrogenase [Alphaproteobacteria bacterium]
MARQRALVLFALGVGALGAGALWSVLGLSAAGDPLENKIIARAQVPPGYGFSVFARGFSKPRKMALTDEGDILVSDLTAGQIVLVKVGDDGNSTGTQIVLDDLDQPHGLALRDGWLYVAEEGAIKRIRFAGRAVSGAVETIFAGLPIDGGHYTRSLKFGPDGWLYVAVGSSCNVCIETNPWRAAILRMRADGIQPAVFATGLRNTVGFDWQPETGKLFGVDNGRDHLGDDVPPDELNQIVAGGFYGWPYFYGDNRPDPDHGDAPEAAGRAPLAPAYAFQAHVAPLSIRFLRHQQSETYARTALVAQHGSWNRSKKVGYRVVALTWARDGTISMEPFLDGLLDGQSSIGRPVDILETPGGDIFITDDKTGMIYRIEAPL